MDSLTQLTLGAAIGEVVLGKRLGNRALAWGALAGTIPDLDVISNFFTEDIYGLVYHRGLTHSIVFCFALAPIFAWLAQKYYALEVYRIPWVRWAISGWLFLVYLLLWGGTLALAASTESWTWWLLPVLIGLLGYRVAGRLWRGIRHIRPAPQVSLLSWTHLFFWGFITHIFIDTCTTYGTQVYLPFSDTREAFNNIHVVDPLYTLPMLLGILLCSFYRNPQTRQTWNYLGLALSSLYMIYTFYNKATVDDLVERNLAAQNIAAQRFTASPTFGNNILWQTVVEQDSAYLFGRYAFTDTDEQIRFQSLPKNHHLLQPYAQQKDVQILIWFSKGYYNVIPLPNGHLLFNDLRFGLLGSGFLVEQPLYPFSYELWMENGVLKTKAKRPDLGAFDLGDMAGRFWARLQGE